MGDFPLTHCKPVWRRASIYSVPQNLQSSHCTSPLKLPFLPAYPRYVGPACEYFGLWLGSSENLSCYRRLNFSTRSKAISWQVSCLKGCNKWSVKDKAFCWALYRRLPVSSIPQCAGCAFHIFCTEWPCASLMFWLWLKIRMFSFKSSVLSTFMLQ